MFFAISKLNEEFFVEEWVKDFCWMPNEQYFSYIMKRKSYIWCDDKGRTI